MYIVCYVLTDSEKLSLFNEMMISIRSLRYHQYMGTIQLITNIQTYSYLDTVKEDLEKYSITVKCVSVPEQYNQMEASRYIKTSLREIIKGNYLFVDTDTVFADSLPEMVSEHEIAMVTDHHYEVLKKGTPTYWFASSRNQSWGKPVAIGEPYFNSGVAWVMDTPRVHEFYRMWHNNWLESCKKGVSQDQPSLNYVNSQFGKMICNLDDSYNVQVSQAESIPFRLLETAKIIHYFHPETPERVYLLAHPEIRSCHYESNLITTIIRSPRFAFGDGKMINAQWFSANYKITKTAQYELLQHIYYHKRLFRFLERCAMRVLKAGQFLSQKRANRKK